MNILIIGNGGREHALAWKIKQSRLCDKLFIAPGNAGTEEVGENVPIGVSEFSKLGDFCLQNNVQLVIVGPEAPLVEGVRDHFQNDELLKNITMVGPGRDGAQLEGSKDFSKEFMIRHGVPTAKAMTFDDQTLDAAERYINQCSEPIVLKADGLAAGKGVIICKSRREATSTIREMILDKKFGVASTKVLVEEFLNGVELSVFVLTDGDHYVILPEAKDYKRIGEQDSGPNTGGMGAVSPVPFATTSFLKKVEEQIVVPTINGLKKDSIDYKGFIFIGLMNMNDNPFVIEYNARMGDPETQVVMPRIKNDLVELLLAAGEGNLKGKKVMVDERTAVTVAMVSGGYPGDYEKGKIISGLDNESDTIVFHAGTKSDEKGVITNGGRVIAVTGIGEDIGSARRKAYQGVSMISWDDVYFRKDIGIDLLNLNK
jgi:phosphoribosylamine--glycine ligase